MALEVSAPIIPLLPDEHHYPAGYSLSKRKRNKDALDISTLTTTFRESLVYEEKAIIKIKNGNKIQPGNNEPSENNEIIIYSDLVVLDVLSPYTLLPHVIIMELS